MGIHSPSQGGLVVIAEMADKRFIEDKCGALGLREARIQRGPLEFNVLLIGALTRLL